jgi:Subtilase family
MPKYARREAGEATCTRQVVVRFRRGISVRDSLEKIVRELPSKQRLERERTAPLDALLEERKVTAIEPLFSPASSIAQSSAGRLLFSIRDDADELQGIHVFTFVSADEAREGVPLLRRDPRIEEAHQIPERHFCVSPQRRKIAPESQAKISGGPDPYLKRQWGLAAIKLAEAMRDPKFRPATDIQVAILDSGIDANHPDLRGVIAVEKNFTKGVKRDTEGHGTHVAGIIAAIRDNGLGIAGVCQTHKLMVLKVLGPYDGPGYYRALRYAIEEGARVMNLSMGGERDPTEELLIKKALSKDMVVVAAMGNEFAVGNAVSYPAAIKGVIAVGAMTKSRSRARFSNTGLHIDLIAPGTNILSTIPRYASHLSQKIDYDSWPGTSMASPFVAAAAALVLAKNPTLTGAQVTKAIQRGADKLPGQTKYTTEAGFGSLNIARSLQLVPDSFER